jgi:hypothetical protein
MSIDEIKKRVDEIWTSSHTPDILIETLNAEFGELEIECTAWELNTLYALYMMGTHKITIGGNAFYTNAEPTSNLQNMKLSRLDEDLHQVNRWVKYNQIVRLVPNND